MPIIYIKINLYFYCLIRTNIVVYAKLHFYFIIYRNRYDFLHFLSYRITYVIMYVLSGTHFVRENRDGNTRFSFLFNKFQLYINSENDLKIYKPFTF